MRSRKNVLVRFIFGVFFIHVVESIFAYSEQRWDKNVIKCGKKGRVTDATIVIMARSQLPKFVTVVKHYIACPVPGEIIFVWNGSPYEPELEKLKAIKSLRLILSTANSLVNLVDTLRTENVLFVDDFVRYDDIIESIRDLQANPWALVGYFVGHISDKGYFCGARNGQYNLVTGQGFLISRKILRKFKAHKALHAFVTRKDKFEFNFLVYNYTRIPPIQYMLRNYDTPNKNNTLQRELNMRSLFSFYPSENSYSTFVQDGRVCWTSTVGHPC